MFDVRQVEVLADAIIVPNGSAPIRTLFSPVLLCRQA